MRNNCSTIKERRNIKQIKKSIIKVEHYKIFKLLNDSTVSQFVTKKWVDVNDLSSGQYSVNKNIRFKTSMLRSYICGYSDAYIVVKGRLTVEGDNDSKERNKELTFKNNSPFRSCISKINNTFVDNAGDLDIVISMYNLLEYSGNYSMTSGSLWNYYRDEIDDDANENNAGHNKINNNKVITSKSFEYKTKLVRRTSNNNNILDAEVVVPLKYLSNVWISLDLPLINCEIELDMSWSKEGIISAISIIPGIAGNPRANHLFQPWKQYKQLEPYFK